MNSDHSIDTIKLIKDINNLHKLKKLHFNVNGFNIDSNEQFKTLPDVKKIILSLNLRNYE